MRALVLLLCLLCAFSLPSRAEPGGSGVFAEIPVEIGEYPEILHNTSPELRIYRYKTQARLFIFDFPDLGLQGETFNRVVALIERMGSPRNRVLDEAELSRFIRSVGKTEKTFAYGNDFLVAELVVFFNLAEAGGIALNEGELGLRQFLIRMGLAHYKFGFFQARVPSAVILSIPQVSEAHPRVTELARKTILLHELSHGEYYLNSAYRNYCRHFWRHVMTDSQRQAFRDFLSQSSYDPRNEEMMINETQAYLMHTPDPRAFNAQMVKLKERDIEKLRQKFREGAPPLPVFEP